MVSERAQQIGAAILKGLLFLFFAFLVLSVITGCSTLPTTKHCQYVSYERTGAAVSISAECSAPTDGSWL